MARIPSSSWSQPNTSDKEGNLWATKNVNLDESGYIKLSPRAVLAVSIDDDANFETPVAIGQYGANDFQVMTAESNYVVDLSDISIGATEDSGTNNPNGTLNSHGRFFKNLWLATTQTTVVSKDANGDANDAWTERVTGLTSGLRHYIDVFASRNQYTVTNGNVLKQYNSSHVNTVDLTIPEDYEMVKTAYNNGKMGVITRTGAGATGQLLEAKFYLWDGSTTSGKGWNVGSDACMDIRAYLDYFAILTREGQWKYFNGGGFEDLNELPFFSTDEMWSDETPTYPIGDSITVKGKRAFLNLGLELAAFGRSLFRQIQNAPSGVWCADRAVGLYHRWSPSISRVHKIEVATVSTTTDILTASFGTIPATGNPIRYVRIGTTGIGGLTLNQDYYIIRHTATTFSLATTKENAINGVKIDLTDNDGATSYFHAYDLVDYGTTYFEATGAVTLLGQATAYFRDILFGGDFYNTNLEEKSALCMVVPFLENRGYFILPKIFSESPKNAPGPLGVKFRPLKDADKIIVKARSKNLDGLPISAPNIKTVDYLTWTSSTEATTTTDLSAAATYLTNGEHLELELVAGAGGNQMTRITAIEESGGTYTITVEDEILGAEAGTKSYFIIDNWKELGVIDSDSESGYVEIEAMEAGNWVQYKIELRGSGTCIEELHYNPTVYQESPVTD